MFTTKVTGTCGVLTGTATPNSKASFPTKFTFDRIYFRIADAAHLQTVINFILSRYPNEFATIFKRQENETIDSDEYINVDVMLDNNVLHKKTANIFWITPSYISKNEIGKDKKRKLTYKVR